MHTGRGYDVLFIHSSHNYREHNTLYLYRGTETRSKLGLVYICHGRRGIISSMIFRTFFGGIVGGYGLRRMCLHYIPVLCDFCTDSWGTDQDKSVRRLYGNRAISVQSPHSLHKLSMEIVWSPCGFRAEVVRRYGDGANPRFRAPVCTKEEFGVHRHCV